MRVRDLGTALAAAFLLVLHPLPAAAEEGYAEKMAARGSLGIPLARARAIETKLGQLLVVNVDGFGYSGHLALAPAYAAMVSRLQVGAVIPHYGSANIEKIRRTNRALAGMTSEPLLICCDIVPLSRSAGSAGGAAAGTARFGDGYVGGFIGHFRALSDGDYRALASLNAFVLAAIGMNVLLGPTVDDSTADSRTQARARVLMAELRRFGVEPVLKHFPFLPKAANLHRESPDTKVALRDVETRAAVFRELRRESGILMTTHVRDSLVDPGIVTFSLRWIDVLRRLSRFDGLLMSDGLLMLANYRGDSARALPGGGAGATGPAAGPARWAIEALLAGHDLLIIEGTATTTYAVVEGLLEAACGKGETAGRLRDRIDDAAGKMARFKQLNRRTLTRQTEVPVPAIAEAVSLAPVNGTDLQAFSFDPAGLRRLEAVMRGAELR